MGVRRNPKDINLIVIHCSATPNGEWFTAEDIDRWHCDRGFSRDMAIEPHHAPRLDHIGYHFVIYTTGAVQVGRPLSESGAHARGYNRLSIGICMIGTDKFTPAQWETLPNTLTSLCKNLDKNLRTVGHRMLSPDADGDGTVQPHEWLKTCPGFDVKNWLKGDMKPPQGHVLDAE